MYQTTFKHIIGKYEHVFLVLEQMYLCMLEPLLSSYQN